MGGTGGTTLSETSQTQRHILRNFTFMLRLQNKEKTKQNKNPKSLDSWKVKLWLWKLGDGEGIRKIDDQGLRLQLHRRTKIKKSAGRVVPIVPRVNTIYLKTDSRLFMSLS